MNSTIDNQAIATASQITNHSGSLQVATKELNSHLEPQSRINIPESLHSVAARLGTNNCWQKRITFQIQTPQRKARYNDKQRIRLKDAKNWALKRSGCRDTAEVKKYLKILGKKLDLRLTSAWIAINKELADLIADLILSTPIPTPGLGDRVRWTGYQPMQAYITQWEPFQIVSINQGRAKLDLLAFSVPLEELVAV